MLNNLSHGLDGGLAGEDVLTVGVDPLARYLAGLAIGDLRLRGDCEDVRDGISELSDLSFGGCVAPVDDDSACRA